MSTVHSCPGRKGGWAPSKAAAIRGIKGGEGEKRGNFDPELTLQGHYLQSSTLQLVWREKREKKKGVE